MKKLSLLLMLSLFLFFTCAQNALAEIDPLIQAAETAKMYHDIGMKAMDDNDIEAQFRAFNSSIYYSEIARHEVRIALEKADKNDNEEISFCIRVFDFINALDTLSYMGIGNYYYLKGDNVKYKENYEQAKNIFQLMMAYYEVHNDINKEDQDKWVGLYKSADKTGTGK